MTCFKPQVRHRRSERPLNRMIIIIEKALERQRLTHARSVHLFDSCDSQLVTSECQRNERHGHVIQFVRNVRPRRRFVAPLNCFSTLPFPSLTLTSVSLRQNHLSPPFAWVWPLSRGKKTPMATTMTPMLMVRTKQTLLSGQRLTRHYT